MREALAEAAVSQGDFARRTGVAQSFISKVTRGESFPSLALVAGLYAEIGYSPRWIITGDGGRLELGDSHPIFVREAPPPKYGTEHPGLHALLDRAVSQSSPEAVLRLEGYLSALAGEQPVSLDQPKRAVRKTA